MLFIKNICSVTANKINKKIKRSNYKFNLLLIIINRKYFFRVFTYTTINLLIKIDLNYCESLENFLRLFLGNAYIHCQQNFENFCRLI